MTGETLEKFYMRKLPELRKTHGMTRKEVAKGVGVTLGKYDKWEAGKVLPKGGDVDRLAEFYGISIDEILEITPEESAAINRQIIADAEHLPFEDATFDAVTCAFGVRNFVHLEKGLGEMLRVLKPDGRMVILELTTPDSPFLCFFYNIYTRRIIP